MLAAVAENVAVVAFAAIVTDAGMVRIPGIPPASVTEAPPAGAALVAVTVHVVLALESSGAAVQARELMSTGAVKVRVDDIDEPFSEADTVAD